MRLLWMDDEGRDKFILETSVLQRNNWEVEWAHGVPEAAAKLRKRRGEAFRIVLLDQHVAEADEGTPDKHLIWGACRLLYWLRGTPASIPRPWLAPGEVEAWSRAAPRPVHRRIPALLVSTYHNNAVLEATRKASGHDKFIKLMAKPVDPGELLRNIQRLTQPLPNAN